MSRVYTVAFAAVAVTAAQDLFEITPADDKPVEILGIELGQSSDAGDAQDELLQLTIIRGFTTSGSGGSAPTPKPVRPYEAAAGFAAEVNNTTVATTGTTDTLFATTWNVRSGFAKDFYEPDARPAVTQAQTSIVVRTSAPADSITLNGTLIVRELP